MTPKEKAQELINEFETQGYKGIGCVSPLQKIFYSQAKQCALIAVNVVINCDSYFKTLEDSKEFVSYWYEVQQEINKL